MKEIHTKEPALIRTILLLTLVPAASLTADGEKSTGFLPIIKGIVVDETGQPVAGASVEALAWHNIRRQVKTGPDGKFEFELDVGRLANVMVLANADHGKRKGLHEFDDGLEDRTPPPIRITLEPSHDVTVRVRNGAGQLVADARIEVLAPYRPVASASTDAAGTALLRLPADANVRWIIGLEPGVGFDYFENYKSSPPPRRSPAVPNQIDLRLAAARTVKLTALDSDNKPVTGLRFIPWIMKREGKIGAANLSSSVTACVATDENGFAAFDWIPTDLNRPTSVLPISRQYHCPRPAKLGLSTDSSELTAQVLRNTRISGKVLYPDDRPAPGIQIQAEGRGNTVRYGRGYTWTRPDGTYALDVRPDQFYIVAVIDKDWTAPNHIGVFVRENRPRKGLDFDLIKGTLIKGRVTFQADGSPAADKTVTLHYQGKDLPEGFHPLGLRVEGLVRWARTDQHGHYVFRVPAGQYQLSGPSHKDRHELTVSDENQIVRDFKTADPSRGKLTGIVLEKGTRPIAGAIVRGEFFVRGAGYRGFETVTDKRGRFTSERWLDDMFVYARSADGKLAGFAELSAKSQRAKIFVSPAGGVRGRVIDPRGKPLAKRQVQCGMTFGSGREQATITLRTLSDEKGNYTFTGLVPNLSGFVYAPQPGGNHQHERFTAFEEAVLELPDILVEDTPPETDQPKPKPKPGLTPFR